MGFCPRQETKMRLLVAAVLVAATSAAPTPDADPQFIATQFVDPMTGAKGYYPVVPATSYVQPTVQTVQPVQAVPQVSYVQAAPHTTTVYTADPMFFNFGRYFNNNLGGKADYGHETGRRPYPTYGDYYRTHRPHSMMA